MTKKIKNIPLSGISTTPDDFNCEDGALSAAINVFHDDGALHGSVHQQPAVLKNYGSDTVVFKHIGHNFANHIVRRANGSFYADISEAHTYTVNVSAALKFETYKKVNDKLQWVVTGTAPTNGSMNTLTSKDYTSSVRLKVIPTISIETQSQLVSQEVKVDEILYETYFGGTKIDSGKDYISLEHGTGLYHFVLRFIVLGTTYTYVCGCGLGRFGEASTLEEVPEGEAVGASNYNFDRKTTRPIGGQAQDYYKDRYFLQAYAPDSGHPYVINYSAEYVFFKDDPSESEPVPKSTGVVTGSFSFVEQHTDRLEVYLETTRDQRDLITSLGTDGPAHVSGDDTRVFIGYVFYHEGQPGINVPYSALSGVSPSTFPADVVYDKKFEEVSGMADVKVVSMKNLLLFFNDTEQRWYTWKEGINYYKYMGDKLGAPSIRFTLEAHFYDNNTYTDDTKKKLGAADTFPNYEIDHEQRGEYDGYENIWIKFGSVYHGLYHFSEAGFEPEDGGLITETDTVEAAKNAVLGQIALFESSVAKMGGFSQPFFVVYALKLVDGSYILPSSPVLMNGIMRRNPFTVAQYKSANGRICHIDAMGFFGKLKYIFDGDFDIESWADIVESIDIFVSRPIYTYKADAEEIGDYYITYDGNDFDEGVQGKPFWPNNTQYFANGQVIGSTPELIRQVLGEQMDTWIETEFHSENVPRHRNPDKPYTFTGTSEFDAVPPFNIPEGDSTVDLLEGEVNKRNIAYLGNQTKERYTRYNSEQSAIIHHRKYTSAAEFENGGDSWRYCIPYLCGLFHVDPVYRSIEEMHEEYEKVSQYYLVKSIPVSQLVQSSEGIDIDISEGVLNDIGTGTPLEFTYESQHDIDFHGAVVYNDRMNIYDCSKRYDNSASISLLTERDTGNVEWMMALVMTDGSVVTCRDRLTRSANVPEWLAYNDTSVVYFDLYDDSGSYITKRRYEAKHHDLLNMSYVITSMQEITPVTTSYTSLDEAEADVKDERTVFIHNEIRTSEVNNPLVFKAENVETVGNGTVHALCPNTTALSEGQFGSHPMYAFTTDGVWALSVSKTGGWAASQPVTRDILMNGDPANILQLDSSIMFSALRGLVLLAGSQSEYISQVFHAAMSSWNVKVSASSMPDALQWLFDGIIARVTSITTERADITTSADAFPMDFEAFIANAVYLYDYRHQRIIVGNPDYPTAYVYGIADKSWSVIHQRILNAVNSYPQCEAMTQAPDGTHLLVDFASDAESNLYHGAYYDYPVIECYYDIDNDAWLRPDKETPLVVPEDDCYLHDTDSGIWYKYTVSGGYDSTQVFPNVNAGLPKDGLVLTRPIKLGDSTALKTIRTINVQGQFQRSHVDIVLFGSSDNKMQNWIVLSSSRGSRLAFKYGTPFKAFRIALVTHLDKGESVSSITIEYEMKEQNKLRQ